MSLSAMTTFSYHFVVVVVVVGLSISSKGVACLEKLNSVKEAIHINFKMIKCTKEMHTDILNVK